jgi:FtsH-binding integral membrane protein
MYAIKTATQVNDAMIRVYNNMFLAVLTSMLVSYFTSTSPELMKFLFTGAMKWVVMFAPLVVVFIITPFLNSNPPKPVAMATLLGFAALMGLSFSAIFVVYTSASIVSAFMGAAVLFGTMSIWGYFTRQNLDSLGKFMFIGLIAVIIVAIINLFIGSSVLAMVVSTIAIIVFLGLTAYDTQRIREMISEDDSNSIEVLGALSLYLNFINIFLNLLSLLGGKRE